MISLLEIYVYFSRVQNSVGGTCGGPSMKVGAWWLIWRSGQGSKKNPGHRQGSFLGLFPISKCDIFCKSFFLLSAQWYRLVHTWRAVRDSQCHLSLGCSIKMGIDYQCTLFICRLGWGWANFPLICSWCWYGSFYWRYWSWKWMPVFISSCISQWRCGPPLPPLALLI